MLKSLKELVSYTVNATDGDVGKVVNFLFDDKRWTTRYLVVKTGSFFEEHKVLISPIFFRETDWSTHRFQLSLTKEKIKHSPGIDTDAPVSRQHERDYYRYYGYPSYWGPLGVWGMGSYPSVIVPGGDGPPHPDHEADDAHLRSAHEMHGYEIQGKDDAIGAVSDLLVDDRTWQVRYLVVDTGHWWQSRKVLVAPDWATRVNWAERKITVDLTRAAIIKSPPWEPSATIRREYEANLHEHYRRTGYWTDLPREVQRLQP